MLPTPNLDDRTFQQLVDEAKNRVRARCPEWTDHNVSDPGVALIEAFCYMVEQLIFRLNQVPERLYVRFLDLLGHELAPPEAARVDLTFVLSAAQPDGFVIPTGTLVGTDRLRARDGREIVFRSEESATLRTTSLKSLWVIGGGGKPYEVVPFPPRGFRVGTEIRTSQVLWPGVGPHSVAYLRTPEAVPGRVVRIRCGCDRAANEGIDPDYPPRVIDALVSAEGDEPWEECEILDDTTGGFTRDGWLDVVVPRDQASLPHHHPVEPPGVAEELPLGGWLRVRPLRRPGNEYEQSPLLTSITAEIVGAVVTASHCELVAGATIGMADGTPAQVMWLPERPVLLSYGEPVLEVSGSVDGRSGWTTWTRVDSFERSGPQDRHWRLDSAAGRVEFGPAVRGDDGRFHLRGASPPRASFVRVRDYFTGGGHEGNVAGGALTKLKSSVPFVARVTNRFAATGGRDPGTVGEAIAEGPFLLRARDRAVTLDDFEALARQASKQVGRAFALPGRPPGSPGDGAAPAVTVYVVPNLPPDALAPYKYADLAPRAEIIEAVRAFLHERRLLGTEVFVAAPEHKKFQLSLSLTINADADRGEVRRAVTAVVNRFYHPLQGGPDGRGWPQGGAVVVSDAYPPVLTVPGVARVEGDLISPVPDGHVGGPFDVLEIAPGALVFPLPPDVSFR